MCLILGINGYEALSCNVCNLRNERHVVFVRFLSSRVFWYRLKYRLEVPVPAKMNLTKGPVQIAATRGFVDYAINSKLGLEFQEWVKHTQHPDETYFGTLNLHPQFGVPGAFTGRSMHYSHWKQRVVMMPTLVSLMGPRVVVRTPVTTPVTIMLILWWRLVFDGDVTVIDTSTLWPIGNSC